MFSALGGVSFYAAGFVWFSLLFMRGPSSSSGEALLLPFVAIRSLSVFVKSTRPIMCVKLLPGHQKICCTSAIALSLR